MPIIVTEDKKVRIEYTKQQHREIEILAQYNAKIGFTDIRQLNKELRNAMAVVRRNTALLQLLDPDRPEDRDGIERAKVNLWFAALKARTLSVQLGA